MKLNLGCGKDYREGEGWINIDIDPNLKADIHRDLRSPLQFNDGSASYILLNHMFEHFTFKEGTRLLKELHRLLRKDGILEIAVPDLDQAVKDYIIQYNSPLDAPAIERIYGNQSTPYEVHKSGYTKESLTKLLTQYSFTITEDLSTPTEIRFKCKKLESTCMHG